jgi:glycosyltransferase involved in cell wall biosynthesis
LWLSEEKIGWNQKMDFKNLLNSIRKGEAVTSTTLLPYLCLDDGKDRGQANLRLAKAYADIGNLTQAGVFIRRSWILSGFSPEILQLYIKIHAELSDVETIRQAYKTIGMAETAKGNLAAALTYFNQWQYAYANYLKLDQFRYDFDVLACIKKMAEPWRFGGYIRKEPLSDRKIRLAYLMFGALHSNSVLVKINCMLAKYHHKDRFEITFFIPDPQRTVYKSKQALETISQLHSYGCDVVISPNVPDLIKRLRATASQIFDYQPDILITSAILAEFEHYFIASLQPAPLIVGLIQGPPQQFASPDMDWGISWSKHPLIDTPCDGSLVRIGLDLPKRKTITPYRKSDFNIPDECRVIMSGGRYVKFENKDFWKAILEILSRYPDLYYVVFGVSLEQIPFLETLLTPALSRRVLLLGWREDCLNILCLADVLVDTYPSGGGHVLIDAMALGIPFVSFENNYMQNYDQTDWSVADEFVSIPELIVRRGDFDKFNDTLSRLLEDYAYRIRMGDLCREQIERSMGNPEEGVRQYENLLTHILQKKLDSKVTPELRSLYNSHTQWEKLIRTLNRLSTWSRRIMSRHMKR